jgi:hypothetical protein
MWLCCHFGQCNPFFSAPRTSKSRCKQSNNKHVCCLTKLTWFRDNACTKSNTLTMSYDCPLYVTTGSPSMQCTVNIVTSIQCSDRGVKLAIFLKGIKTLLVPKSGCGVFLDFGTNDNKTQDDAAENRDWYEYRSDSWKKRTACSCDDTRE